MDTLDFQELDEKGHYEDLYTLSKTGDDLNFIYWRIHALWRLGKVEEAYNLGKSFAKRFEELHSTNKRLQGLYLRRMGTINTGLGNINIGLEQSLRAMIISKDLGNKKDEAISKRNVGMMYLFKGEINLSSQYLQESLELCQQHGPGSEVAGILSNIGMNLINQGKLEEAIPYFEQALQKSIECQHTYYEAMSLHLLVRVESQIDKYKEKAEKYLDQLATIGEVSQNQYQKLFYLISKGIYLKSLKRTRELVQASDIFTDILENYQISNYFTLLAIKEQLDILLLELQIYDTKEVHDSIHDLVLKLTTIAWENKLLPTMIDSLIFQSKLAVIQGEFTSAQKQLKEAMEIASSNRLEGFQERIKNEMTLNLNLFNKYQKLLESNKPISEKLKNIDIDDYLKQISMIFF